MECDLDEVREGLMQKVAFEQRPAGGEGVRPVAVQGKSIVGGGNSECESLKERRV